MDEGPEAVTARLSKELQETLGRDDLTVEFNTRPLLRTKKSERRWPEDFRGFGTNVRPKKQK